ncbi:lipid II flippase MurJ [Ramlibacter sp. MAHUQ-53]|uniref:lipid II flippase MurJ n=1 Tax=unclassified Ramlibacter TaxID=2617605 RepID=UPI0036286C1D
MFLKAGALSLALLLASRLLGLARETAQAAAFGTSGLADVAVLLLTLPDWLTGVAASGALAYVLVPAWAGRDAAAVARSQRRVARVLLAGGVVAGLALALGGEQVVAWLAGGLPPALAQAAAGGLAWSGAALPLALLAALWATRLQHERDFVGLYGANLVVNAALIAGIGLAGWQVAGGQAVAWLGGGLMAAMGLRLLWQQLRIGRVGAGAGSRGAGAAATAPQADGAGRCVSPAPAPEPAVLPVSAWLWAALSAGLPLALPFAARSLASLQGEGALAAFNYAWKLVELPLMLAIQLVATLAFPAVAAAVAGGLREEASRAPVRHAFTLAWALGCAAAAGLLVGADAVAQLLFGWGRMDAAALARVAEWGRVAAWGLLPQALAAVALTVLASQQRLRPAAVVHAIALAGLLAAASVLPREGAALMLALNAVFAGIALALVAGLGGTGRACLPVRAMALPLAALAVVAALRPLLAPWAAWHVAAGFALAGAAALAVLAAAWPGEHGLRRALRR